MGADVTAFRIAVGLLAIILAMPAPAAAKATFAWIKISTTGLCLLSVAE